MIVGSFIFFLALFLGIGLYAHLHSRHSHRDYLLANQETPPWLAGLSAGATANSGYMFTGLIGYAYLVGLPSIWLGLGMIIGDIVASSIVHRRLRSVTNMGQAETYAGILSHWNGTDFRMYRHLAGFVSLIFLSTYAAAQFVAGSKALHVLFGWEEFVGALIGAAIVASYSWAGGIRASIWTDALQAIVMMVAMIALLVIALDFVGGISAAWAALDAVSPTHLDLVPPDLQFGVLGPLLFGLGWIVAGFCVVGQPHIMVRFMTLDRPENTNRARVYYYAWTLLFGLVANAVGLLTRILLPPDIVFDAELALPTVALDLLPGILVGVVIAGMFAATLSTADSLILSCAANLTDDFAPEDRLPLVIVRGGTLLMTLVALAIALSGDQSVFTLVILAWSMMGAVFAPLITVYALGGRPNQPLAIAMLVSAVACVVLWQMTPELALYYKGFLGFIVGFVVYLIGSRLGLVLGKSDTVRDSFLHHAETGRH